jgi:DNA-binding Lrp family transcriptional regulator
MDAYVLIQTDGNIDSMVDALRSIPGVAHADDLTGPYDAIALTRSATMEELTGGVLRRIRELPGVTRALPAPLLAQEPQELQLVAGGSVRAA